MIAGVCTRDEWIGPRTEHSAARSLQEAARAAELLARAEATPGGMSPAEKAAALALKNKMKKGGKRGAW